MSRSNERPITVGDIVDELAASALFGDLQPEFQRAVAECAVISTFTPGERLLTAGDPSDRFWLIRHGRIDIEIHGASSGTLTIGRLEPGDVLGVSWIAEPFRAEFDATAVGSGSAILVDAACLRGKCNENHELGHELYRRFASMLRQRLHATRVQLLDLYEENHAS